MEPVKPFEPVSTDEIPTGPSWVGQVKWDGVRILTYYDGSEIKLFNRRLNERTYHYPELLDIKKYCGAQSVILDGEVIALKDGMPSFYTVMKRDGISNLEKVNTLRKTVPITYMIFDGLYYNGKWITNLPFSERQEILDKIIKPNNYVQLVENFPDAKALYKIVKDKELEGIVIKDITSAYLINGKDRRWRKKKHFRDLIAVVGGVTLRGSIVNSLLLGLYNPKGELWYIGHAGTGKLTQEDWRTLTQNIQPLIQTNMPFTNRPPRYKECIWLKPLLTVKVNFTQWLEGPTLRQPSIQAFVKADPKESILP